MTWPAPEQARASTSELGPFFRVDAWAADDGWRSLGELTGLGDPTVLGERVDSARATLAGLAAVPVEGVAPRVAASIVFLGLAARLVSPALGSAVVTGLLPAWAPDSVWWRPVPGGPWPLATSGGQGTPVSPGGAAPALEEQVLESTVAPVLAAFAASYELSEQVLWGNVASAVAGALTMIGAARPEHAERAADVVGELLRSGRLQGTGDLVRPDPLRRRWFLVRRSCCLFYRVPGGGTCADCVLTPDDVRRQQWQSALTQTS